MIFLVENLNDVTDSGGQTKPVCDRIVTIHLDIQLSVSLPDMILVLSSPKLVNCVKM